MKLALAIICVLFIPYNSFVCDLIAGDDINFWWTVRLNLYSIIFCLLFIIHNQKTVVKLEKYFNFTMYVGIGLTASDVIDRCLFSVNYFKWTDLIMVGLVLLIGYRKYLCHLIRN